MNKLLLICSMLGISTVAIAFTSTTNYDTTHTILSNRMTYSSTYSLMANVDNANTTSKSIAYHIETGLKCDDKTDCSSRVGTSTLSLNVGRVVAGTTPVINSSANTLCTLASVNTTGATIIKCSGTNGAAVVDVTVMRPAVAVGKPYTTTFDAGITVSPNSTIGTPFVDQLLGIVLNSY